VVKVAARTGQPYEVTYRVARVDGRLVSVRDYGYAVREGTDVTAIEGIITNLTRPTDRELEHLALDVAHDLNNALGTIKTTAELSQLETKDGALLSDLADIVAAANRGSGLVDRLRRGLTHPADPSRGSE
jgi:nitrogen-specific signal transduction histidine kinase